MTTPDETHGDEDTTDRVGVAGSLAAASEEDDAAGDPLGPLNRITEDDQE